MRPKVMFSAVGVFALAAIHCSSEPASAQGPTFEVASVRPNTDGPPQGFFRPIRKMPGGRFVANWVALRDLIFFAYGLQVYQKVEGDDPILDARFDVQARATNDVPRAALGEVGPLNLMVQALLAERFGLAVRWEGREQPVSLLVLAREDGELGSHLRRSTCPAPGTVEPAPEAQLASTSSYLPPCGSSATTNGVMQAPGQTMSMFARNLSRMLDEPVLNRTGLDGVFDVVDLSFDGADLPHMRDIRARFGGPEAATAPSPTADKPSLFTALEEDLGLKHGVGAGAYPRAHRRARRATHTELTRRPEA